MSALGQTTAASPPTNSFHAYLTLGDGITANINAPSIDHLQALVSMLQPPAAAGGAQPPAATPEVVKAPKPPRNSPAAATPPAPTPAAAPAAAAPAAAPASGPNYNEVRDRVLALAKVSRETATAALSHFGVDHANKLKLEQYADFIAYADNAIKNAEVPA